MVYRKSRRWLFVWLLPALLLLATIVGLGSYYETNDDTVLTLFLQGRMSAVPITSLHLYFHGVAAPLAYLYQQWPDVPWYGLLLYGLLYLATALLFRVLYRLLRAWLRPSETVLALALFFLVGWLEHAMWFNYMRVPLLLAAAGVWYAAARPARNSALVIGILAFGIAWLIRPSAAVLGLLLAVPGAWWLSGRRSWRVLASAAALALVGALAVSLTRSPTAATFRRLDVLKSNLNDYQLLRPTPRTAIDSLGVRAVQHWLLADSTLVNEELFERALPLDATYFVQETVPAKLRETAQLLVQNYFPLLVLLLLSWIWVARRARHIGRREFVLVQVGFGVGLLLLAGILKLPPRLALPYLDAWVLANGVFMLKRAERLPRRPWPVVVGLVAVIGLYGYKTVHRRQVLYAEQRANSHMLRSLAQSATTLLVADGLETYYKSRSPFDATWPLSGRILSLSGWQSLSPEQAALRAVHTGTRAVPDALRYLAAQKQGVQWVLTPAGAELLNNQLEHTLSATQPAVQLRALAPDSSYLPNQPQPYVPDVQSVK
ncbi:hypothetical protein [Hymenobacter profundi]|uniref:Glycosyltransferase RgtA/B/C/D-like domain-containing protein n=1 Tax=Hymenobacter profundi TaxID=1982110 RepID=A0ABS6X1G1_9BACT|nr:hypothetical protein [Hymenobacter profundi]MBW3129499.1 hypothetical protein [Hymenobacter profundi]